MKFFSNITLFISALAMAPSVFSSPATAHTTMAGRIQKSLAPLKKYTPGNMAKRSGRKANQAAHQEKVANGEVYNLQKSFMNQKALERQVNRAAHEKKLANGDVYKIDDVIGHLEINKPAMSRNKKIVAGAVGGLAVAGLATGLAVGLNSDNNREIAATA